MLPLTLALKGADDVLQYVWLGLAGFSIVGLATRMILLRRGTAAANAWAEALVPTRRAPFVRPMLRRSSVLHFKLEPKRRRLRLKASSSEGAQHENGRKERLP
jgi:hypothetical protein